MLLVDGIPNSNLARLVSGGDVETTWRVFGDIDLAGVLGVDVSGLGIGQVANDNAVSVSVQEVFALGISAKNDGSAPFGSRKGGPDRPVIHGCDGHGDL